MSPLFWLAYGALIGSYLTAAAICLADARHIRVRALARAKQPTTADD